MFRCKEKIWLQDIKQLFNSAAIVPLRSMNLAAQMNSLTRLVIIVLHHIIPFRFSAKFIILTSCYAVYNNSLLYTKEPNG